MRWRSQRVGCAEHAVGQERAQPLRRSTGLPRRHTLASAPRWRPPGGSSSSPGTGARTRSPACARCAGCASADTRVVCVDNGSTDGSVAAVRERYPEVDVIENGRNLGFSGGNNAGIRARARARRASGSCWSTTTRRSRRTRSSACARAAAAHPAAGMLAGKVFFDEPPDRIWFAGQRFWPALGYSGRPRGYGRRDGPRYRRRVPDRPRRRARSWPSRAR